MGFWLLHLLGVMAELVSLVMGLRNHFCNRRDIVSFCICMKMYAFLLALLNYTPFSSRIYYGNWIMFFGMVPIHFNESLLLTVYKAKRSYFFFLVCLSALMSI